MLLVESNLFQPLYFYTQAKPSLCLINKDPYADGSGPRFPAWLHTLCEFEQV